MVENRRHHGGRGGMRGLVPSARCARRGGAQPRQMAILPADRGPPDHHPGRPKLEGGIDAAIGRQLETLAACGPNPWTLQPDAL